MTKPHNYRTLFPRPYKKEEHMSVENVEQILLIVDRPASRALCKLPEQYAIRNAETRENTRYPTIHPNTTLLLWYCPNTDALTQATDFAALHPNLAIIIASEKNHFANIAELYRFGSIAYDGSAEEFLHAESRAYSLAAKIKKTG